MNNKIKSINAGETLGSCINKMFILKLAILIAINFIYTLPVNSQVGISTTSITPDPSSILELRSTNTGFLPPRMTTTDRDGISSPAIGLLIYNTSTNRLNYYNGSEWQILGPVISPALTAAGTTPGICN